MDRGFRRVYSKDNKDARLQRDDEDNNQETDEEDQAEDHQWFWLVPSLPAIDIDATVPRFASRLLPVTHDCPNDETWQWSVSIYETTVEYHRNNDNPVYPSPSETFPNPDPLDFYPDVHIPLEPRPPSPVPGPSRQRDAPHKPAFESLNSQQDNNPGYFMLENSSASTAMSPAPSTSRQSEERERPAKLKQYRKNTTRFLSRWQRGEEDPDTGTFRSAFRPYARPPKVTITPRSPPLPYQTADVFEVVPSECVPSMDVEIDVEVTREATPSPEQTAERNVDSPISPLLILSSVCSEELRLLEADSDRDEKT